ncbi:MAG TPA: GTP 3',8-cyclase MoaA [Noviherbaspirillum sp.]|uniref:GTP 3',8-cyclase MoaA n=1 Tax=Noviherbaspirillum sp. TaxID=1926288 RepID=UPI002D26AC3E|nr:GTP 3',8-cyclase MoaA [Noviherbaspirillum sp.]HYD97268.1 GTP 3',8-cyclase MoaA [Noviherbaspirillum sp.]
MYPTDSTELKDRSGRPISYLRLSVTDRCDFRCSYCMPVSARFLPREQVMTLEENLELVRVFTELGVRKVRLTGGEPLVRKNLPWLVREIKALPLSPDVVLTTNGSQLAKQVDALVAAGLSRINVSLDSLDSEKFTQITHSGRLQQVLDGLMAAKWAGLEGIKLNVVAMRDVNDRELVPLVEFAIENGFNISFIEEMPFGDARRDRAGSFMSSGEVKSIVEAAFPLVATLESSGGPARYHRIPGTETRVGFISPHSHNFCDTCNRLRVSAAGELYTCLGSEGAEPLSQIIRSPAYVPVQLKEAILGAVARKPRRHDFSTTNDYRPLRFMSKTGG